MRGSSPSPGLQARWLRLRIGFCFWTGVSIACAASLTNDPLCTPNIPSGVTATIAASNGRMATRLQELGDRMDPRAAAFLSDRSAALIRESMRSETNAARMVNLRFQLAIQLVQSGRTEEAMRQFKTAEDQLLSIKGSMSERGAIEIRMRKAIGLLRLAEQENCEHMHHPEACIFPIRPAAYHQLPRGSRGAIQLFNEQLQAVPGDLAARWLVNIAHMTLGEWPGQVPPALVLPPTIFASEYTLPRFPDIAGPAGLAVHGLAGGCVMDDFDNDGLLDVVASEWSLDGQLRYFHNDGNGRFTERTSDAGLIGLTSGLNIQQTDYNNDGWLDLWVPRGAWLGKAGRLPNSLLRNNGNGSFTDVTEEAGLLSFHPVQTSVWFDYDGDGWLDLFNGNESSDPADPDPVDLFHNNRNGTFTECAAKSGIQLAEFIKGATSSDYDNDGRPDLYLSNRAGRNFLFHNEGTNQTSGAWSFKEVGKAAGVTLPLSSFSTWFFDYDNDGWDDLFVSGYGIKSVGDIAADYLGLPGNAEKPKLYRNNRNGTFSDVTVATHLNRVCHTMGCNFGDLDNDGWLDFYVATGDPDFATLIPNRMFRNAGGKFFQEVSETTGTGHLQKGHGVAFGDLDNDGDQDIYCVLGGAFPGDTYWNSLFMNPGAGGAAHHWLKLKLVGTQSNRAAIGARIQVTLATPSGTRVLHKTVNSGASFGANPLRQEFGLGDALQITRVEVIWPASGRRQTWTQLALDSGYQLLEGQPTASPIQLKPFTFSLDSAGSHSTHARP